MNLFASFVPMCFVDALLGLPAARLMRGPGCLGDLLELRGVPEHRPHLVQRRQWRHHLAGDARDPGFF